MCDFWEPLTVGLLEDCRVTVRYRPAGSPVVRLLCCPGEEPWEALRADCPTVGQWKHISNLKLLSALLNQE